MAFITQIGKQYKYKVTGDISAWYKYSDPNPNDPHARGESTERAFSLKDKVIKIVSLVHRVEKGYPTSTGGAYAAYQVVKIKVVPEENNAKDKDLWAWVVYEGVKNVELIDDEEEGTKIEVKAGETLVLELRTGKEVGGGGQAGKTDDRMLLDRKWGLSTANCNYPLRAGNLMKFYNDSFSDESFSKGFYPDVLKAIEAAEQFIFIAGWSLHLLLELSPNREESKNKPLGKILIDWCRDNPNGVVAIHTWNHTEIGAADDQNDYGEQVFQQIFEVEKNDFWGKRLFWRASSNKTNLCSHHQKFIVCDQPSPLSADSRKVICSFVGGIDLTKGRMDNSSHALFPPNGTQIKEFMQRTRSIVNHDEKEIPYRWVIQNPKSQDKIIDLSENEWYNPEFASEQDLTYPRMPWHDIHSQITGPSAWDVLREFVGRWRLDEAAFTLGHGVETSPVIDKVLVDLVSNKNYYGDKEGFEQLTTQPTWTGQILRSMQRDHWGLDGKELGITPSGGKTVTEFQWKLIGEFEKSIVDAYESAISQAENFIYIETQYFIGSGDKWVAEDKRRESIRNDLPNLIADKIIGMYRKGKDFHVYLILPFFPEGKPTDASMQAIRDFQWRSIEMVLRKMYLAGIQSWQHYLTLGFLANWSTQGEVSPENDRLTRAILSKRYMIYVHSKMMIVDDEFMIIGSANLNERSLAGNRDTELCAGIWPDGSKKTRCRKEIGHFRNRIWQEHFNLLHNNIDFDKPGSFEHCAKQIQEIGKNNWNALNKMDLPPNGHFCSFPDLTFYESFLGLSKARIFDAEDDGGDDWNIWPADYVFPLKSIAE